jgi:hypothetical protein
MAVAVCLLIPIMGFMNPNMGMSVPCTAKVGPRRGCPVLPSLLPLFLGNYFFSLSMLRHLVGAALGRKTDLSLWSSSNSGGIPHG